MAKEPKTLNPRLRPLIRLLAEQAVDDYMAERDKPEPTDKPDKKKTDNE